MHGERERPRASADILSLSQCAPTGTTKEVAGLILAAVANLRTDLTITTTTKLDDYQTGELFRHCLNRAFSDLFSRHRPRFRAERRPYRAGRVGTLPHRHYWQNK